YGLTQLGRQVVQRCEQLGIAVDLAHAGRAVFRDVIALATRPVFVSHTGARAVCDSVRNLDDDQLRAVAATGGIVGIAFFQWTVCGTSAAHVVRAIMHVARVVGIDHVALGSDWDGTVTVALRPDTMAEVTGGLLDAGLGADDVYKVM